MCAAGQCCVRTWCKVGVGGRRGRVLTDSKRRDGPDGLCCRVKVGPGAADAVVALGNGDMRRTLNILQVGGGGGSGRGTFLSGRGEHVEQI